MCAMALVHSRVRRVVYCAPDAAHGALGGALRLHAQRSLNHHYRVYRLPLAGAEQA
jgi:tRNA-specific adenosine deaminase 3